MAKSDSPAPEGADQAPMSALRRRTAKMRAERATRLAENLRANIGRRKQQVRARDEEARQSGEDEGGDPPL